MIIAATSIIIAVTRVSNATGKWPEISDAYCPIANVPANPKAAVTANAIVRPAGGFSSLSCR